MILAVLQYWTNGLLSKFKNVSAPDMKKELIPGPTVPSGWDQTCEERGHCEFGWNVNLKLFSGQNKQFSQQILSF